MSDDAFLDPEQLRSLAERAAIAETEARRDSSHAATIASVAELGWGVGSRLAGVADAAERLHRRCAAAATAMEAAASGAAGWAGETWARRAPPGDADADLETVAQALEVLRARRRAIDLDGDGRVDEHELVAAIGSPDGAVAAAAAFVLDGAPSFPSPSRPDAPRPTVPELLMVLNMAAADERDRVVADVAVTVARDGGARALGFEVVAAGTPFDVVELEEGRLLLAGSVTVAPPERLRSWDLGVPDVDLSVLADDDLVIPAATASIGLTYRSETTFHEYTVDPLPDDVPQAAADVLGDLSDYTSVLERAGAERWNPLSWAVQGAFTGVSAWNLVDDVVGDAHPRVDTSVVVDATFYDAAGVVVGRVDALGIDRTAATGPLFASVGSVLVVPAPDADRADDDDGGS